jgi:hypothetical protein
MNRTTNLEHIQSNIPTAGFFVRYSPHICFLWQLFSKEAFSLGEGAARCLYAVEKAPSTHRPPPPPPPSPKTSQKCVVPQQYHVAIEQQNLHCKNQNTKNQNTNGEVTGAHTQKKVASAVEATHLF